VRSGMPAARGSKKEKEKKEAGESGKRSTPPRVNGWHLSMLLLSIHSPWRGTVELYEARSTKKKREKEEKKKKPDTPLIPTINPPLIQGQTFRRRCWGKKKKRKRGECATVSPLLITMSLPKEAPYYCAEDFSEGKRKKKKVRKEDAEPLMELGPLISLTVSLSLTWSCRRLSPGSSLLKRGFARGKKEKRGRYRFESARRNHLNIHDKTCRGPLYF